MPSARACPPRSKEDDEAAWTKAMPASRATKRTAQRPILEMNMVNAIDDCNLIEMVACKINGVE